jgi:hypothetical protein
MTYLFAIAVVVVIGLAAWMALASRPTKIAKENYQKELKLVPFSERAYARRLASNLHQFSRRRWRARSKRNREQDNRRAANWRRELDALANAGQKRQLRKEARKVINTRKALAFKEEMGL